MTTLEALTKIGNCQTQVDMPVFKFKRKEYKLVQDNIINTEQVIKECIELLKESGINSKEKAREKLEEVIR